MYLADQLINDIRMMTEDMRRRRAVWQQEREGRKGAVKPVGDVCGAVWSESGKADEKSCISGMNTWSEGVVWER